MNYINYDGYIEGVGKTLIRHYEFPELIKPLIYSNEIRSLGESYEDTEFYPKNSPFFKKRKKLTFDELCNEAGNVNYTYIYTADTWHLLRKNNTLEKYFTLSEENKLLNN